MSISTASDPSLPSSQPRPIRFVHRGRLVHVNDVPPTVTVLEWLREKARCTGTKEGCAEGDCGACTVVLGQLDAQAPGGVALQTVNACIQLMPTLDGKALFTVEDVQALQAGAWHPCQTAMVACHGSQCGFCTPGFVMSLWHMYQRQPKPLDRAAAADALSGNLCRCTGYRPILDAAQRMYDSPRVMPDFSATQEALRSLPSSEAGQTFVYSGTDPAAGEPAQRFIAPAHLDDLAQWRQALPKAQLLAGGTDVGLWVTKQHRALGDVLYLGRVGELQTIQTTGDALLIGAGVSLEQAWGTLVQVWPPLREMWLRFASPPVRHAGTLGGNIANGSPIGDSAPVLLALGAALVLRCGAGTRQLPLAAFYLDYMKNALQPGEFLQALRIPLPHEVPGEQTVVRAYKLSKRRDSDISAVCLAVWIRLQGQQIVDARVAMGGMAATARRAPHIEAALVGQAWTAQTLEQAQSAMAKDFTPLSDCRASADYRLRAARGLLKRCWLETRPQQAMAAEAVQVWPAVSQP